MSLGVVFAGGPSLPRLDRVVVPDDAVVIAADSGLDHARRLGFAPKILVGDLDSISEEGLRWARENHVVIDEHPTDKDETDLELAVAAAAHICDEVLVLDGGEGRLDQLVANITVLAAERFRALRLSAAIGGALVTVVRTSGTVTGRVGDLVSLFAIGGPASGVTTTGLRWALLDAVLEPGATLGVSNELLGDQASIEVAAGTVLVIQP